jgi:hypothetical protein
MRRASPAPARLATRDATRIEKRQSAAADWNITHGVVHSWRHSHPKPEAHDCSAA